MVYAPFDALSRDLAIPNFNTRHFYTMFVLIGESRIQVPAGFRRSAVTH